jgi:hypothetical protein
MPAKMLCRVAATAVVIALTSGQGCPLGAPPPDDEPVYNNTTDRTNGNARFLGSAACRACHPDTDDLQRLHGHAHMLKPVLGAPPSYPPQAARAGVPTPPPGFDWSQVSYVIGGYLRKANFVNQDGYVLTSGTTGMDTQWNLPLALTGEPAHFVPYQPGDASLQPYNYSCFVCHTTGPQPPSAANPRFQDNRPGMAGTWVEAGVQCEACHGPGSNHVPNPEARDIYVNTSAAFCGECHSRPFGSGGQVIQAANGYIQNYQQYGELLASGGHSGFECVTCHDPHVSVNYDRGRALRQTCTGCHEGFNMALHEGITFVSGDYVERVSCQSCHMPPATLSASFAEPGGSRIADMRTHIFRINTENVNYTGMFTPDLRQVRKDADGRAAVTVDFVCLRCHHGTGSAFALTVTSASEVARVMHQVPGRPR